MLNRLLGRSRPAPAPTVGSDTVVYAIGDVHGAAGLLAELHRRIQADAARRAAKKTTVVHLGDYIDRGERSRDVLDMLCDNPLPGCEVVNLLGNHDAWFMGFLEDPSLGPDWLANGGQATLLSYGVGRDMNLPKEAQFDDLRRRLKAEVPAQHLALLNNARLSYRAGDYLFVHAGIRPGIPIPDQTADDLLWIREDFLGSDQDHGAVVVHGHTVVNEPTVQTNRIGIDTGAYATGVLTALVLHGAERAFLTTG